MRTLAIIVLTTLAVFGASAQAGEWSPSDAYVMEATAAGLRDLPPEQIARYLIQPYPLAAEGAALALADKGESVLPLIERLVASDRAALRAGGARVLVHMLPRVGRGQDAKPQSPAMQRAVEAAVAALERPGVEPHEVHADLANRLGHDSPLTRRVAIRMTDTDDAGVRAAGLTLAMDRVHDDATCATVARQALERPNGNTARHYAWAGKIALTAGDKGAVCLKPAAKYLAEQAHSQRGMFTNAAMNPWLDLVKTHASEPDAIAAVPGIVRCYLRLSDHSAWVKCGSTAVEALTALGPDAAPLIEREVAAQLPIIDALPDWEIDRLQTNRERIARQADALRKLANQLRSNSKRPS